MTQHPRLTFSRIAPSPDAQEISPSGVSLQFIEGSGVLGTYRNIPLNRAQLLAVITDAAEALAYLNLRDQS